MRPKSILLLALALGCGLVAAIGLNQVMAKKNVEPVVTTGDTEPVFVAIEDVPAGEVVTPQMIKLEQWPKDKIPEGTLSSVEDIEGRRSRAKIYAGDIIRDNKLFQHGESGQVVTEMIPKGYRVVAVKVDSVSAGGALIRPTDRVDVLVHLQQNPSRGIPATTTRTILQDIKVFAVNDVFKVDPEDGERSIAAKTISLLVTPEQAEKVTLASNLGMIRLVLRSHADAGQSTLDGADASELLGGADGADRDKEETEEEPKPKEKSGFAQWLEMLKKNQEKPAHVVVADPGPQEPSTWKFRLLEGGEVSEVTLELESEPGTKIPSWTTNSSKSSAAFDGGGNAWGAVEPQMSTPSPNQPPDPLEPPGLGGDND